MPTDPDPALFHAIDAESDLDAVLARSEEEPVVLFKHSVTCGISARARTRMMDRTADDPPVFELIVQRSRPLSNAVAERLGIRHASPQAIVLFRGRPIHHASHGSIRMDAIRDAVHDATSA